MPQLWEYILELTLFLDSPIGRSVNALIGVLFSLGVIDVLWTTIRLVQETRALNRASAALRNPGMSCPEEPAETVLKFLRVSNYTLIGRVVAKIIQLRAFGLSHREVTQLIATEPFQTRPTLSRYVASTLPLIGLLGTVLGLSIAVARTQGAVLGGYDLGALRELAAALAVTLAGMKTAFATTLTGLLTALLLSGANYATSCFESRVIRQLQAVVISHFLPHLKDMPAFSSDYEDFVTALKLGQKAFQDSIASAVMSSEAILEKLATDLARETKEILASQRQGIQENLLASQQLHASASSFVEAFVEQNKKILKDLGTAKELQSNILNSLTPALEIRERLYTIMTGALASHEATIAESTLAFRSTIETMTTAITQQLNELTSSVRSSTDHQELSIQEGMVISQALRTIVESSTAALASQASTFERTLGAMDALRGTIADLAKGMTHATGETSASRDSTLLEVTSKYLPGTKATCDHYGAFESLDTAQRDLVECTVFAPPQAVIGESLLVQVFVHTQQDSAEAVTSAEEFDTGTQRRGMTALGTLIERGAELTIQLSMRGLTVSDSVQRLIWRGKADSAQFAIVVPGDTRPTSTIGTVLVFQNTIPIGRIMFKLDIVAAETVDRTALSTGHATRFEKAFISYASKDRPEVQRRVQMLEAVGITYFQDLLHLDPGERWKRKLFLHIKNSDVLFLFWSTPAKESEWVSKEWRYALEQHDKDFVMPVVIEGPPIPEPPPELRHLNFSEKHLYFIQPRRRRGAFWVFLERVGLARSAA